MRPFLHCRFFAQLCFVVAMWLRNRPGKKKGGLGPALHRGHMPCMCHFVDEGQPSSHYSLVRNTSKFSNTKTPIEANVDLLFDQTLAKKDCLCMPTF